MQRKGLWKPLKEAPHLPRYLDGGQVQEKFSRNGFGKGEQELCREAYEIIPGRESLVSKGKMMV